MHGGLVMAKSGRLEWEDKIFADIIGRCTTYNVVHYRL